MENLIRTTVLSTRAEKAAVRRNGCQCLPLVSGGHWQSLPVDEEVQREVLLQKAARQRRRAMHLVDSGAIEDTPCSVQAALFSMANAESSGDMAQERELLGELLDLIATNKLSLARKVMDTTACMRTSGRNLRDRQGRRIS